MGARMAGLATGPARPADTRWGVFHMSDMSRNWFFELRDDGAGTRHDDNDDDSAPGLTCVPAAVLDRHGARAVDPRNAAAGPFAPGPGARGQPAGAPHASAYRARAPLGPAHRVRRPTAT